MIRELWHFTRADGPNILLNNAWLNRGVVASVSVISRMPGLENAITLNDFRPALGPFESILEQVRAKHFQGKPSRRGAFYAFDDRAVCELYARLWAPGAPVHILRCVVENNANVHCGHLGLLNNPPQQNWLAIANSYWSAEKGPAPDHWEYVIDGQVFFPDWQNPPFGRMANAG